MLALVVVPLMSIAQVKIATIDVQAIFNDMPEAKQANELLNSTSQKYSCSLPYRRVIPGCSPP